MARLPRRVAALALALVTGACTLPPIDLDEQRPLSLRSTVRAADGSVLARLYRQNRALVPLESVPDVLIDAVLAAEDARFFDHPGFDIRSIARAALVNASEGTVEQGGSTITQQYVKNVYFRRPPRTFERKARELRLALEVEKRFSKRTILERYLNTIYLGSGAYGVEAASENLFGHSVRDANLVESALIAAVIKAPTLYDPRSHPKRARERRNYVLDRMASLDEITPSRARRAKKRGLGVQDEPPPVGTRQPYFVEAVKREILSDDRFGATDDERARLLWTGGIQVETTLVPELQRAAERSVRTILDAPGDPEAAIVSIEPSTGRIVAMVGGRDWNRSQVNLALGRAGGGSGRQPGSSFKPIVAATAMEQGIPLTTSYGAGPAVFTFEGSEPWVVRNSEGTAGGSLPIGEALVRSVNGVFARLAIDIGAGPIVSQARLMGVRSKIPAYPAIALGSAEVSVLDMATAYATLANGGTAIEPTTLRSVTLASGEDLSPRQEKVESAVSPGTAYLLSKALEQVIERGTGTAADIGRPAAGKTGTTNDYGDAWFVGYTPQLATAVWVGYPNGRVPMTNVHGIRVTGGSFPAAIWRLFMRAALDGRPLVPFELPKSELVTVEIDPVSGLLAAPWCPGKTKTMLRQMAPTELCPQPPPSPSPLPSLSPLDRKGRDEPSPSPSVDPETPSPSPSPDDDDEEGAGTKGKG